MRRIWGRAMAAVTVVALPALLAPGCAHDDTTLFIYDVLAQAEVAPGTACTFTSSVSQPFITSGVVDIDLRTNYLGNFLLGNQMIAQANPNESKTETSFIQVQGAVVTIKDETGRQQLAHYTVNAAATVPPATGGTPGFAAISGVPIVDMATLMKYGSANGRFLTFTQFFGVTLGGQSVTSNTYEFPVDMCEGCLIGFTAADVNPMYVAPNCAGTGQAAVMTEPCIPGQDLPIDCSLCLENPDCNPPLILVTPATDGGVTSPPMNDGGSDASAMMSPDAGSDSGGSGPGGNDASTDAETLDGSDGSEPDASLDASGD